MERHETTPNLSLLLWGNVEGNMFLNVFEASKPHAVCWYVLVPTHTVGFQVIFARVPALVYMAIPPTEMTTTDNIRQAIFYII